MTDMPTTYETHQTTTTTTAQGPVNIAPRMEYLRTVPGILKIVEIILDLIVFICACIIWWGAALGWIRFVSMSAFLTTLVYFILYFINAVPQIHKSMGNNVSLFQLIEFIYYIVFSIFYLIAAIVAASYAKYHSSIAACTFFAFAATAVYAVDTFFQYRAWRSGQAEMSTNVTATTTTTTTTHQVETREQYAGQTY